MESAFAELILVLLLQAMVDYKGPAMRQESASSSDAELAQSNVRQAHGTAFATGWHRPHAKQAVENF